MTTALVTGGSRGIGRGICKALAGAGFDVAIVDQQPSEAASATVDDVHSFARKAVYLQQDIADLDSHGALIEAIRKDLGTIDCLVNNAGVTSSRRGDMLELTVESFDRNVAVNLRGTFFLT